MLARMTFFEMEIDRSTLDLPHPACVPADVSGYGRSGFACNLVLGFTTLPGHRLGRQRVERVIVRVVVGVIPHAIA